MAVKLSTRVFLVLAIVTGLVIVSLLVAVIVLGTSLANRDQSTTEAAHPPSPSPRLDLLAYLHVKDGIDVRWSSGVTTLEDIKAVSQNCSMIDLPVTTSPSSSSVLFVGKFSLQQVLDIVTSSSPTAGVNLNISPIHSTMRVIVQALEKIKFERPIIISIPMTFRENTTASFSSFLQSLQQSSFSRRSLAGVNLDITAICCGERIGIGMMEHVVSVAKHINMAVSIKLDSGILPQSADDIKWFMDSAEDTSLILSSKQPTSTTKYDLLIIRNDIDSARVFYNVQGTIYNEFVQLALTAGSPLLYFNMHPPDAGNVKWSHNTDTWELLHAATSGEVMMVEGDIMLKGQGTAKQQNIPIMAHDVGDDNNLTFAQWFDEIIKVKKGMKFDFKSIEAVKPALDIVLANRAEVQVPIWLNADILKGPNGGPSTKPPADFLKAIQPFPEAILSLGWTTGSSGLDTKYTKAMVEEMNNICKGLPQPVTFPIRAYLARPSWEELDWLLKQSRGYTLTIWTSPSDNVAKEDMDFVKRRSEISRVYFDLPNHLHPSFT